MDALLNMLLGMTTETGILDELTNVLTSMDEILINLQTQVIYIKQTMNALYYLSIGAVSVATVSLICTIILLIKVHRMKGK